MEVHGFVTREWQTTDGLSPQFVRYQKDLMERGGIKILPITTKDGRNELLRHSTTCEIPAWPFVSV
jgi:hypothetical protein